MLFFLLFFSIRKPLISLTHTSDLSSGVWTVENLALPHRPPWSRSNISSTPPSFHPPNRVRPPHAGALVWGSSVVNLSRLPLGQVHPAHNLFQASASLPPGLVEVIRCQVNSRLENSLEAHVQMNRPVNLYHRLSMNVMSHHWRLSKAPKTSNKNLHSHLS